MVYSFTWEASQRYSAQRPLVLKLTIELFEANCGGHGCMASTTASTGCNT